MSVKKLFELYESEPKPRTKNQVWMKDVGYDEAPWYSERMGPYVGQPQGHMG